ncbi:glycosyl hydrolase 108 family protein [Rhodanobacter sp. AS-Z3]|uniref:glycoside hydrolase family 108 protein n=1 Tax=Rhodanobacter sp. AS-Z3 TaxID=3031330 RepID=UPI002478C6BB|nr:glycosyl hydrolase 108 family protein [Rhodanobacter sp. AS-Z3]WEN13710.1 glycosyl hydrolase 108 family protein [Rhodanobacter sp. AS-Z3]
MSAANFAASLQLTLGYEGGFSDHPLDPGGATMCGVTQRVYDEDRDARRLARQSVRLSTEAERAAIYRQRYWATCAGDALPVGVDYAVFDFAVNSGVGRSVRTLQRLVGVADDGAPGRYTLAAVQRYCAQYNANALTDAICHARMQFLRGLPTFGTFGKGWTTRVMGKQDGTQLTDTGVIDRAYAMAMGAGVTQPATPIVTPKTYLATAA